MNITYVPISSIRPADWRTTHILKPDLKLLVKSMVEYGWLSPIIVRKSDSKIIDGFHRWMIADQDAEFRGKYGDLVPVLFVDVDLIDAMMMHIRLNRSRGQIMAKYLSLVVRDILVSKKYDTKDLRSALIMTDEELAVLIDGSLIKHRNIKEHKYSKAWIPVEISTSEPAAPVAIERPPNADR